MKNEVILWPLTSSKIIVLVAQPISTDGGPPAWAVDKRAELGWPSSRGKGWPAVCKSGPRLWKSTVVGIKLKPLHFEYMFSPSACSCGGFLFARQAPSGGGYAGFVTGQRTKMAGKVL